MVIIIMTTTRMTFTLTLRTIRMALIMKLRIINIVRLKLRSSKLS